MRAFTLLQIAKKSPAASPSRLLPGEWSGRLLRLLSLGSFFLLWQTAAWSGYFTPYQVPAPAKVSATLGALVSNGDVAFFLSRSLQHYGIGLAWGISLGVLTGLVMAWFRRAEQLIDPIITALRPIPPLAWIPFAIIWFGITTQAAAFLISLGAFYITIFATHGAVKGVDPRMAEVARTLGERSDWAVLRRVILPSAMPGILTGVRTSLGQGWMTVVAAEMFGIKGVGMQMLEAAGLLAMDVVISYMIVIGVVYFCLDMGFKAVERHLLRWR